MKKVRPLRYFNLNKPVQKLIECRKTKPPQVRLCSKVKEIHFFDKGLCYPKAVGTLRFLQGRGCPQWSHPRSGLWRPSPHGEGLRWSQTLPGQTVSTPVYLGGLY